MLSGFPHTDSLGSIRSGCLTSTRVKKAKIDGAMVMSEKEES